MKIRKTLVVALMAFVSVFAAQAAEPVKFVDWLQMYITTTYTNTTVVNHGNGEWFQAKFTDSSSNAVAANWAVLPKKASTMGKVEGLKPGRSCFLATDKKENWATIEGVTYFEGAGYYISGYDASKMGSWEVEKDVLVQFTGDAKKFAEGMAKAWAKARK
jgi:hypothetical protein